MNITSIRNNCQVKSNKTLNNHGYDLTPRIVKWIDEFEDDFSEDELKIAFSNITRVTNCIKYRDFQYRLLNRAIITNIHLVHWKMRANNLCTFCNMYKESYAHLFVKCSEIQPIWKAAEQIVTLYTNKPCVWNVRNIICNTVTTPASSIGNLICVICKQYIYRQRCTMKPLNIIDLKTLIQSIQNIEKYNAIKHGRLSTHEKKWCRDYPNNSINSIHSVEDYIENYFSFTWTLR